MELLIRFVSGADEMVPETIEVELPALVTLKPQILMPQVGETKDAGLRALEGMKGAALPALVISMLPISMRGGAPHRVLISGDAMKDVALGVKKDDLGALLASKHQILMGERRRKRLIQ